MRLPREHLSSIDKDQSMKQLALMIVALFALIGCGPNGPDWQLTQNILQDNIDSINEIMPTLPPANQEKVKPILAKIELARDAAAFLAANPDGDTDTFDDVLELAEDAAMTYILSLPPNRQLRAILIFNGAKLLLRQAGTYNGDDDPVPPPSG